MTTWPGGVPWCFRVESWSEAPQSSRVRFDPEVGEPMLRRRSTVTVWLATGIIPVTTDELSAFWDFYVDTLANGTLSFTARHPYRPADYDWMITDEPRSNRLASALHDLNLQLMRLP